MRILVVDHFDSFTHNLAQVLGGLGADVAVRRSDAALADLLALAPGGVVLSPGPGTPTQTGVSADLVRALDARVPVLGVCLGMQLLAVMAGGEVARAPRPVHGRATPLAHDGRGVFAGLPQGIPAGRYHSLAVVAANLPPALVVTAWSEGVPMGLRSPGGPCEGVQFHPESILTPHGPAMLRNFLAIANAASLTFLRGR